MIRFGALGWALLAVGCVGNEIEPCPAAKECPVIDEEGSDTDVLVSWMTGQKLAVSLDGKPEDIEVTGGEVVYTPDPSDLDCQARCAITLRHLRVEFATLYFASSQDSVKVKGLELAFEGPTVLGNPDGMGSVLPNAMTTRACATAENVLSAHESALTADSRLVARTMNEALELDLTAVPMLVDGSTDFGCTPFHLELAGTLAGTVPFDRNPVETAP